MQYSLFFNHLSTPAINRDDAINLTYNMFQGVLKLSSGDDSFVLYCEKSRIEEYILFDGFTYQNFIEHFKHEDRDFYSFLIEITDKTPFEKHINDDELYKFANYTTYIQNYPTSTSMDIFTYAFFCEGIVISLETVPLWSQTILHFMLQDSNHVDKQFSLYNISKQKNTIEILSQFENLPYLDNVYYTEYFTFWYNSLRRGDKNKIKQKIKICASNNFEFHRPIIDVIENPHLSNLKEIRLGSSVESKGRIRIFFIRHKDRKVIILLGFIKHDNNYETEIRIAKDLYDNYCR